MNLLFVPLTIGLPAIDESLDKLLVAMETLPNVAILGMLSDWHASSACCWRSV